MRDDDIPWEATRAPVPVAPPLTDLSRRGEAGRIARRYHLRERAVGRGKLAASGLARVLPPDLVSFAAAHAFGPLAERRYKGTAMRQRMDAAIAHLRPDLAHAQRKELTARWFQNTARMMLEFADLPRIAEPRTLTVFGSERLGQLRADGRSAVCVSIHLASWELIFVVSRHMPVIAPYQPQSDRYENRIVESVRERYGVKVLPPSPRLLRTLYSFANTDGQAIVLLLDEVSDGQIKFPLFGRPIPSRCNLTFTIRTAQKTGAALIPVTIERLGGPRHALTFHEEVPTGSGDAGTEAAARALNSLYEPLVRRRLDQWYMLHKLRL